MSTTFNRPPSGYTTVRVDDVYAGTISRGVNEFWTFRAPDGRLVIIGDTWDECAERVRVKFAQEHPDG